jgi:hypothetical protein
MMEAIYGRPDTEFLFEALKEATPTRREQAAETESFSFSCSEWSPRSLFAPVKISCFAFARRPVSPARRDSVRQERGVWRDFGRALSHHTNGMSR